MTWYMTLYMAGHIQLHFKKNISVTMSWHIKKSSKTLDKPMIRQINDIWYDTKKQDKWWDTPYIIWWNISCDFYLIFFNLI